MRLFSEDAMPFCPTCRTEYRPGIAQCAHCQAALVEKLEADDADRAEALRDAVAKGEAAAVARSNYAEACQVLELLHQGGVDAMVNGDPASCGKGGNCSHFFVHVLKDDVALAHQVLRADFKQLLAESEVAVDPDAAVDLDAEGPHACPACGTKFEGTPQECPDCGLFIGAT
jgi:hypothetical protein